MSELLLKKTNTGSAVVSIVKPTDDSIEYALIKQKESLLTVHFAVQSKFGDEIATIKMEHILFTPAKMPKLTITIKGGDSFVVKKEIEQLSDVINVEGGDLTIGGNPFSKQFELLRKGKCIAMISGNEEGKIIRIKDENYEKLVVLFALAIKLAN